MNIAITALILIFLTNFPSLYFGWYIKFWWIDTIQHFLGGFFVAMFFAYYLKDHFLANKKFNNIVLVVGATILIGVVWEFAEYMANQILVDPLYKYFQIRAYFMGDLKDTIKDMALDISGALLLSILHFFRRVNPQQIKTTIQNENNSAT